MIPSWAAPFVGLPYENKGRTRDGVDCWGLVRLIYNDVFNAQLPDYSDAYTRADDRLSVASAVENGLTDGWIRVERAAAGDLVILRIGGRPWHCGCSLGGVFFLHAPPPDKQGRQSLSCIERLDSPHWSRRIEGIYRRKVAD